MSESEFPSAAEVIAASLNTEIVGHSGDYNGGRLTYSRSLGLAIQGLDALREAGWELICPAEATHSGTVSTSFGWVTSWAKAHQVHGEKRLITVDGIHRCISADEARVLAAQLLAAAVSQDGDSDA